MPRRPTHSYDWQKIEGEYVSSSDAVTYRVLCAKYGFNLGVIGKIAKREKWGEKRARFREQAKNRLLKKAQKKEVELQGQQFALAQGLMGIAIDAMKMLDPLELSPQEIRLFIATACDLNQKALLMIPADMDREGLTHEERVDRLLKLLHSRGAGGS